MSPTGNPYPHHLSNKTKMDNNEKWLPVVGYEGLYEVSSLGNVKSIGSKYGIKNLTIYPSEKGYATVSLSNGKTKTVRVHRLVAIAFIPNPENKEQVNHINGVKLDNIVENLEWCTVRENQVHSWQHLDRRAKMGLRLAEKPHHLAKLNAEKVSLIRSETNLNAVEAAEKFGVHYSTVYLIRRGGSWKRYFPESPPCPA